MTSMRVIEVVTEAIPQSVIQLQAVLAGADNSIMAYLSLASSIGTTSVISAQTR